MSNSFQDNTLHLHRRLTIQPHVLVSSDLQVPLQHVEQHGELQKTSQIDHKLNILSFHLREDEHPVPPPPDLGQHVVQQLELSCWGKQ